MNTDDGVTSDRSSQRPFCTPEESSKENGRQRIGSRTGFAFGTRAGVRVGREPARSFREKDFEGNLRTGGKRTKRERYIRCISIGAIGLQILGVLKS